MSVSQQVLLIAVVVLGTMTTRFLPFLLFPADKPTPPYIRYLGKVLPGAALGMLVIYAFKNVNFLTGTHGIPELLAALFIILLHWWKKNMLLSIAGGTIFYMLLVQFLF